MLALLIAADLNQRWRFFQGIASFIGQTCTVTLFKRITQCIAGVQANPKEPESDRNDQTASEMTRTK